MREHTLPFFSLPAASWLADTTRLRLDEQGLLIRALAVSWRDGPLPANPARLARTLGITAAELKKSREGMAGHFQEQDGMLVSPALEAEYRRACEAKQRKRAGALQTNASRWGVAKRVPARSLAESQSDTPSGSPISTSSSSTSSQDLSERIRRLLLAQPRLSDAEVKDHFPGQGLRAGDVARIREGLA